MNYKEGYQLTIDNAKVLMQVSQLAAESKNFGLACSLNILAAEETIKSLFMLVRHYFPDDTLDEWNDLFKSHTVKHKSLKSLVELSVTLFNQFEDRINKTRHLFLNAKELLGEELEGQLDFTYKFLEKAGIFKNPWPSLNTDSIIKWLDGANDKKNNGIYVNEINNKWKSPNIIKQSTYLVEQKYCQSIFDYVLKFDELMMLMNKSKEKKAHKLNQP